ncbi:hypothetical protein ACH5RR_037268 [Cinchona calisaya]|uniref:Uncharacterized protein n=1 Tax=Cinchona calisaya TaxID=153742 RepID=A0ABD2Y9Z5_9GENT
MPIEMPKRKKKKEEHDDFDKKKKKNALEEPSEDIRTYQKLVGLWWLWHRRGVGLVREANGMVVVCSGIKEGVVVRFWAVERWPREGGGGCKVLGKEGRDCSSVLRGWE